MKLMVASDIHGSARFCRELTEAWRREAPDRLLLLGDLLYHGPRNDLPDGYAPKEVIAMLNALSPAPLCVRGNCEAEVDQMVLNFPVLADYAWLDVNGLRIFATHGHLYGEDNPPPLAEEDILLCGHTHVPAWRQQNGILYLNPGSVSLPKEQSPRGYLILEQRTWSWRELDGRVWHELSL